MKAIKLVTDSIDATVGEALNRSITAIDKWVGDDAGRAEAVFLGGAAAFSFAGISAEIAARQLDKRHTVPAALGRNALRLTAITSGLAAGLSTYLAGEVDGIDYASKSPKKRH